MYISYFAHYKSLASDIIKLEFRLERTYKPLIIYNLSMLSIFLNDERFNDYRVYQRRIVTDIECIISCITFQQMALSNSQFNISNRI